MKTGEQTDSLAAERWDTAYEKGRYDGEPPIPFVSTIIEELGEEGKKQIGLYVGCGNGRNYIPLLEAGYRVHGTDISNVAIEQLKERYPDASRLVYSGNFEGIKSAGVFDYIVAIQVFQHGDKKNTDRFFDNARMALKPGGRLFLRLNSARTDINYAHEVIEGDDKAGKTILYREGPKEGMKIHFYSGPELEGIMARNSFGVIVQPYEITEQREPPATGTWTQWETIWQKA